MEDIEKLKQLIEEENNKRKQDFIVAYNKLCEEHNASLTPIMTITTNGVIPQFDVILK